MDIQTIERLVSEELASDPLKLLHVRNCLEKADELALIHHGDRTKVRIAVLLHDITKLLPLKRQQELASHCMGPEDLENHPREVWHAYSAACYARTRCDIQDEEVLDAIRYHTTGRKHMSLTEKIVFVSDAIEVGRTYVTDDLRELAKMDLDQALIQIMQDDLEYLRARKRQIDHLTIEAVNYYLETQGGH